MVMRYNGIRLGGGAENLPISPHGAILILGLWHREWGIGVGATISGWGVFFLI